MQQNKKFMLSKTTEIPELNEDINMLLISNMYPSQKFPVFGCFIPSIIEGYKMAGINNIKKIVRYKSNLTIISYIIFYANITINMLLFKFNLIHVSFPSLSYAPLILFKRKIRNNSKLIVRIHGSDFLDEEKRNNSKLKFLYYYTKMAILNSDLLLVPSELWKDMVEKRFPDNNLNIFVYPSGGINPNVFYPKSDKPKNQQFNIGIVSRIDSGKGIDTVLKAFSELDIKEKFLHIVGEGALLKEYVDLSNKLKIKKSQIKFYGQIERTKLADIYNCFDIFIFSSELVESFGNTGIEALSCGVPVIATQIGGGTKDYIIEGYNGYFYEPGNKYELINKILEYYNLNKNDKIKMTKNSLEIACNYDMKYLSEKLNKKINDLLNKTN